MIDFLVNTFVKDHENINDSKVRENYGLLSSVVGIICNVVLFMIKIIMGTIANSIAIVSDAFNNLSDCLSCIVTLVSYRIAAKPADKDHPFGHGRVEYLASLTIAILIIVVGMEFLRTSFNKLLNPEPLTFKWIVVISLVASILTKVWMYYFNMHLGKKLKNSLMLATATDSLSDSITTAVTLISLFACLFTDLPVDGVIGIIVSLLILRAGYSIIKDTVDTLLGKPADEETVRAILAVVLSDGVVLGTHDLIIHNYGPGNMIASIHAEVDCEIDILIAHDRIDMIEKEVYDKLNILLTIHMDPIDTKNEQLKELQIFIDNILKQIHPEFTLHDFRMVSGATHTNLIFDVVVPYDLKMSHAELKAKIDLQIASTYPHYLTVITFDSSFSK